MGTMWHHLFHGGKHESWEFTGAIKRDGDHWITNHKIACSKCGNERTQEIAWCDFPEMDMACTMDEAIEKAYEYVGHYKERLSMRGDK